MCALTVTLALDTLHDIYKNLMFRDILWSKRFAGSALHLAAIQRDKLNAFLENAPTHRPAFSDFSKKNYPLSVENCKFYSLGTEHFTPGACLLPRSLIEVESEQTERNV